MAQPIGLEAGPGFAKPKTPGEKLEGIAFTFCKVATVALIAGKFTLPIASGLASLLYVWAYAKGQRDTRCVLFYPLLIAAFWAIVSAISFWAILEPGSFQALFSHFWR